MSADSGTRAVSAARCWVTNILGDALIAGLIAIYTMTGAPGALIAIQVWAWTLTALTLVVAFRFKPRDFQLRPPGFSAYHYASEFAFITAFAWMGMPALAVFRVVTVLLMEGARHG